MDKKTLILKLILNKKNNQINFNLPRKQLPKEFLEKLKDKKKFKFKLEGWE